MIETYDFDDEQGARDFDLLFPDRTPSRVRGLIEIFDTNQPSAKKKQNQHVVGFDALVSDDPIQGAAAFDQMFKRVQPPRSEEIEESNSDSWNVANVVKQKRIQKPNQIPQIYVDKSYLDPERKKIIQIESQKDKKISRLKEKNREIKQLLLTKEEEIESLRTKTISPSQEIADPQEVAKLAQDVLLTVMDGLNQARETGSFEHARKRIAEIREVFALCLAQLNAFNEENSSVAEMLSLMTFLDVSVFFGPS